MWLVLIVIGAFALVMLIAAPLLTRAAKKAATDDLSQLLDAGETLLDEAQSDADAVAEGAEGNLLSKARAVARFLAHDDELLQTDALVSMCELLEVSAVDVTDYAGTAVASSVAGRIGRNLVEEPGLQWTKEVLDGEGLERTRADSTESALLWGCVPRTDTDGFILIQTLDRAIITAQELADPQAVLRSVSFIRDEMVVTNDPGRDGDYVMNDRFYVRRTHALPGGASEVALVASRGLGSVYLMRNATLLVLALFMLACILLSMLVQTYLRRGRSGQARIAFDAHPALLQSVGDSETPDDSAGLLPAQDLPDGDDGDPLTPSATDWPDASALPAQDLPDGENGMNENLVLLTEGTHKKHRSGANKAKKKRPKLFEFVAVEPDDDAPALPAQDLPDDDDGEPLTLSATDWPDESALPAQDLPDGENGMNENLVLLTEGTHKKHRSGANKAKKKRPKLFEFVAVEPDDDAPALPAQDLPDDDDGESLTPSATDWPHAPALPAQDLPDAYDESVSAAPWAAEEASESGGADERPAAADLRAPHSRKSKRRTRKQTGAALDVEDGFDKIFD